MRTIVCALLAVFSLASVSASGRMQAGNAPAKAFTITGQIRNPGRYAWEDGLTVDKAIALAGGITDRGTTRNVRIVRVVDGQRKDVTVTVDAHVLPDDVVTILSRVF